MKACFKCMTPKFLDEFYAHPSMKDGYLNKCKVCTRRDVAERRRGLAPADILREQSARNASAAGRDGRKRWAEKNRPRVLAMARAARRIAYAVQTGRVMRGVECEQCRATGRIEAAHQDYTKPLEVRWLCVKCHRAWDRADPKTAGIV